MGNELSQQQYDPNNKYGSGGRYQSSPTTTGTFNGVSAGGMGGGSSESGGSAVPRIRLQQSVSFDGSSSSSNQQKRRISHSHFSDYSLYPDRFDYTPTNRSRSLSTGSTGSSTNTDSTVSSSPKSSSNTDSSESQRLAQQNMAQKNTRTRYTSAPPRYNFFDYSLYPDKDPKSSITKR